MIHYETCSICPERRIGMTYDQLHGIVFCEICGERETEHNIRIGERAREEKCKFFGICEYRKVDGYTCNHAEEAGHFCGKYRELNK